MSSLVHVLKNHANMIEPLQSRSNQRPPSQSCKWFLEPALVCDEALATYGYDVNALAASDQRHATLD